MQNICRCWKDHYHKLLCVHNEKQINTLPHFSQQAVLNSLREVRNRMWVSRTRIYPKAKLHNPEKIPILYELSQHLRTKSDLNLQSHTVANKIFMAEICRQSIQALLHCPLWLNCPSGPMKNNNYNCYKFYQWCHYCCCCCYYNNYCEKAGPSHHSFVVYAWMNMKVLNYYVGDM